MNDSKLLPRVSNLSNLDDIWLTRSKRVEYEFDKHDLPIETSEIVGYRRLAVHTKISDVSRSEVTGSSRDHGRSYITGVFSAFGDVLRDS